MNPIELLNGVREILREVCGCRVYWEEHPNPLSDAELLAVKARILELLDSNRQPLLTAKASGPHS